MEYMQSSDTVIFSVSANAGANASSDTVIFSVMSAQSAIFRPRLLKSWNQKNKWQWLISTSSRTAMSEVDNVWAGLLYK